MKGKCLSHEREEMKQAWKLPQLKDTLNHDAQTVRMMHLCHESHMGKAAGCICPTGESQGRVQAALHRAETGASCSPALATEFGWGCKVSADSAEALQGFCSIPWGHRSKGRKYTEDLWFAPGQKECAGWETCCALEQRGELGRSYKEHVPKKNISSRQRLFHFLIENQFNI